MAKAEPQYETTVRDPCRLLRAAARWCEKEEVELDDDPIAECRNARMAKVSRIRKLIVRKADQLGESEL